jgi:Winged helix DNA-binding domain
MAKAAKPAAVTLPASKVAAWRLVRQRLAGNPARDPQAVARDLVGVQAQVLSSAALSIAIRSTVSVEGTPKALAERRLIRSWGMRGTLHVFDGDDFPTFIAALRLKEPWRRPAWLRYFGMTERQMEEGIDAVGEILDDGVPRTRAQLADDMDEHFGRAVGELVRGSWGTFLKQAANKGYASQAWTDDSSVAFVRPDRWLPRWRTEDPDEAHRTLVLRYLAVYGPASPAEVNRWWGVTGGGLKAVIRELGDELTEVEVDGERGLIRRADLVEIEATATARKAEVVLLGPFDPLTVGAGLRSHLIPAEHLQRVSRTAGWISPVVLVDGRVAGVWASSVADGVVKFTVDPFASFSSQTRAHVSAAASRITEAYGATGVLRYGRVFINPSAAGVKSEERGDVDPEAS